MRRIVIGLFAILFGFGILFLLPKQAQAQFVACDACGLCQTSTSVPSNWLKCAQCMYPNKSITAVPVPPTTDNLNETNYPTLTNEANYPTDSNEHALSRQRSYTALGCIDASPGKFSEFIIRLMANLITGIGVLGLVYGGLKVMMARGDKNAVQEGKMYVVSAIAAILIVNFAALIVKFAGQNILQLPFFR